MLDTTFSENDFSELMYPVYVVDQGTNLMSRFQELKKMPYFASYEDLDINRNQAIRYVIYCYDRESPILKRYRQEDQKRKTLAAHYAGFKTDKEGLFEDKVDLMMKGQNKQVNLMIIDYVRQYNDPEYSILVAGQEALYQKLQKLLDPGDEVGSKRDIFQIEETRGKLFNQATEMGTNIDKLATKILNDENRFLKRDLYCIIDEKTRSRLPITPERMAKIE